jgi:hypothetical protein
LSFLQFILSHVCILCSQHITHFVSQLFTYHTQCTLQSFSVSVFPLTRIWRFCVFSPVSTHLVPIAPTRVVHLIISHQPGRPQPRRVQRRSAGREYIVMPTSKRPQKGTTRKVAPKPHSPLAAPDVAKKGRKPPRIREDFPWSPSKVVRQKLAPPAHSTIDLTIPKET